MSAKLSRREVLRRAGVLGMGAAAALAGCQPKVVEVTKIVEKEVEKIVKETVQVEKVVKETVVVEKEVAAVRAVLPEMKLRFGFPGWAQVYAQAAIATFQATEPNVEVALEPIGGDFIQKLYTMAAGETTPETQWICDAHVLPLGTMGVMLDMNPLADADADFDASDIYPIMKGLGEFEGAWYMLAWACDAPVMYYNKTLFQEAGVADPDPLGMPVSEFQQACAKITNQDEEIYGWHGNEEWWAIYVPWMEGFGGRFYNEDKTKVLVNSPECAEGCQALADMYVKYNAAVPKGADLGGDPFILGRAATAITNRNKCSNIRQAGVEFEWDVTLPPIQPVKHVCGTGTMGPGVSAAAAKTGKEVAAWKLAKAMVAPATQKYFCREYLIIPVLMSMANDPSWYDLPAPPGNRDVFLEIPKRGITPPNPRNNDCGTVYIGETNKAMNDAWGEMVVGGVPAQEALDKAAEIINECMAAGGV